MHFAMVFLLFSKHYVLQIIIVNTSVNVFDGAFFEIIWEEEKQSYLGFIQSLWD